MEPWILITGAVVGGGGASGLLGAWLVHLNAKRREASQSQRERDTTVAERTDDARELAKDIREEVALQLKPVNDKLEKVTRESQEMNDAVRANATHQWYWEQSGRPGALPMLPPPVLEKLGLGQLLPVTGAGNQEGTST